MKHKRIYVIISIAVVAVVAIIGISAYLLSSLGSGTMTGRESPKPVSIEIWLSNKELSRFFLDYKMQHPHVNVEIRTFRSYEQLYNELTAAISAQNAPHIAEVNSHYGIAQLADSGALLPLQEQLSAETWERMSSNVPGYFEYRSSRWALPYGLSINVLYYNKHLLAYSGMKDAAEINYWSDLSKVDGISATEKKDESRVHWALVVDQEVPWYLRNIFSSQEWTYSSSGDRWREVFDYWRKMIYELNMMPPLQHHLAMSDFIDGRAVFFLSSSDKWSTLEKYIGGKFVIGMMPIPQNDSGIPNIHGMVVLRSTPEQEASALESVEYLLSETSQYKIWAVTGKTPVRLDVIEQLHADLAVPSMYRFVLDPNQPDKVRYPRPGDKDLWKLMEEIGENLELTNEVPIETLVKKLLGKGEMHR